MLETDPPARMKALDPKEFTDETREFFGRWTGGIFKDAEKVPPLMVYAHHPQLADLFSQLNMHLLSTSTLSVKHRQLAIMRAVWLCKSVYAWSSHLNTSRLLGLETDMFRPIQVGAGDPYFTAFERTIIQATDEFVSNHEVSDNSWEALKAEWSNKQMLDFLFTVGAYVLTAGVLRSTGVERDERLRALAAEFGAPSTANGPQRA